MNNTIKTYYYGMRLRGFGLGCQPMIGFIKRHDDPTNNYYDIIEYKEPLLPKEIEAYSLDELQATYTVAFDFAYDGRPHTDQDEIRAMSTYQTQTRSIVANNGYEAIFKMTTLMCKSGWYEGNYLYTKEIRMLQTYKIKPADEQH